jgi:hypothetical protein
MKKTRRSHSKIKRTSLWDPMAVPNLQFFSPIQATRSRGAVDKNATSSDNIIGPIQSSVETTMNFDLMKEHNDRIKRYWVLWEGERGVLSSAGRLDNILKDQRKIGPLYQLPPYPSTSINFLFSSDHTGTQTTHPLIFLFFFLFFWFFFSGGENPLPVFSRGIGFPFFLVLRLGSVN